MPVASRIRKPGTIPGGFLGELDGIRAGCQGYRTQPRGKLGARMALDPRLPRLDTRAVSCSEEDTSGFMAYELFESGRRVAGEEWDDGIAREKQRLIGYLASVTGGPVYYTGRGMKLSHQGMKISESDWEAFLGHAVATMNALGVGETEQSEIAAFVSTIKDDIVEC